MESYVSVLECLWGIRLLNTVLALSLQVLILHLISSHEKEGCVSANHQKIRIPNNGNSRHENKECSSLVAQRRKGFFSICLSEDKR